MASNGMNYVLKVYFGSIVGTSWVLAYVRVPPHPQKRSESSIAAFAFDVIP